MPTKTDRILSYLPQTFNALTRPTVLYSVADAFGSELLKAENSLAALMLAHWIDRADKGAEFIQDLACIASLYGLSPRSTVLDSAQSSQNGQSSQTASAQSSCPQLMDTDETVEQFRNHLKRYIRTFMDGTTTVQGILRITAEALGLHIADAYAQMDTWWNRPTDALVTTVKRGEDAAKLLFGVDMATVTGQPPKPARVVGTVNLGGGTDLGGNSTLHIKVDASPAVDVTFSTPTTLSAIVNTINTTLKVPSDAPIASQTGEFLALTSPTLGANSQLEVQDIAGDAAPVLLGLPPHVYRGSAATAASVTSTIDLQNGISLHDKRFLRLQIDGNLLAEIDCAGTDATHTTLDDITKAINAAFVGITVASNDGHFLTLTSPTNGLRSSIAFLLATAQDAKTTLFGSAPLLTRGNDPFAAQLSSTIDLSQGIDLSTHSQVSIQIDTRPPITINCAGAHADNTSLAEIVTALTNALGPNIVTHDGRFIHLTSPTTGPASTLILEALPENVDATAAIFGIPPRAFHGSAATPAHLVGTTLSQGVDLSTRAYVSIKVDAHDPVTINCTGANPPLTLPSEIVSALNAKLGPGIATYDDQSNSISLISPTIGPNGTIVLESVDAIQAIFGTGPTVFHGTATTPAHLVGAPLGQTVDLSTRAYVSIQVDAHDPITINCVGANPSRTLPSEIVNALNAALGPSIATYNGQSISLTSPTTGPDSTLALVALPNNVDATQAIFGIGSGTFHGAAATPAQIKGTPLGQTVDLSAHPTVSIRVDDAKMPIAVNCAGQDAAHTLPSEIVSALNTAFGFNIATYDGQSISLTSLTVGTDSTLALESADATQAIFGTSPKVVQGTATTHTHLDGTPQLSTGVDLRAKHIVQIALDSATPTEVDVWSSTNINQLGAVTPTELVQILNAALGDGVAIARDQHIELTSPTAGGASRIEVQPLETTIRQRFITRAYITDEASYAIFGFVARQAQGIAATPASLLGKADLHRGVDLRQQRFLRISLDGQAAQEIDFAKNPNIPRPRAAALGEIVNAINDTFGPKFAAPVGPNLILTSQTQGSSSNITFEPPRGGDTLDLLLGLEPSVFHGSDATRVTFVSTVDLSPGVDLSNAHTIRLGIDAVTPKDIDCAGTTPEKTTLQEIVNAINKAFTEIGGVVANMDGRHIILTSPTRGSGSKIEFDVPSVPDATQNIFGIAAPRLYTGSDAAPAKAIGHVLSAQQVDLKEARHLVIATDGKSAVDVDFSTATNITDFTKVKLTDIVTVINSQPQLNNVASLSQDGTRLILSSANTGAGARIELQRYTGSDAHDTLLGQPEITPGQDPTPAIITGDVDLLAPVDLSERRIIRLALNGQRPIDLDVSGKEPDKTSLDEIVTKINSVIPGLASATQNDHLQLTAPTGSEASQLELIPLRTLDLIEYPPTQKDEDPRTVSPGDQWAEINDGAAASELTIDLSAPSGVVGPSLVNLSAGLRLRLLIALQSNESVHIQPDAQTGVSATIITADGKQSPVPAAKILAGPPGAQTSVPFEDEEKETKQEWALTGGIDYTSATLQLNNPLSPVIVVLSALQPGPAGNAITVSVTKAALPPSEPVTITTDGQPGQVRGWLKADATGYYLSDASKDSGTTLVRLHAGAGIALNAHLKHPVIVYGPLHYGDREPLMVVTYIADLFDLVVKGQSQDGQPIVENYNGVSIGTGSGPDFPEDIVWQIIATKKPSQLLRASTAQKGAILTLPRGRTIWVYHDNDGARFDTAVFDTDTFNDGTGKALAIFDTVRFSPPSAERDTTIFGGQISSTPVNLQFHWTRYQPGTFIVNLPDDLPDQFGTRFNEVRFGSSANDTTSTYELVVTEPESDDNYIVKRLVASKLVNVSTVSSVPIGWDPVSIPFRHPRTFNLSGGTDNTPAQLYLQEEGVPNFIKLSSKQEANESGVWGNDITVRVSRNPTRPAHYDVTISYEGVRLDNAPNTVAGGTELPSSGDDLLKPSPVGILQAKAVGIQAVVTRNQPHNIPGLTLP